MATETFPASLPAVQRPAGAGGEYIDETVLNPSSAGYRQSWPLFTTGYNRFKRGWAALTEAHLTTFRNFLVTVRGAAVDFSWSDTSYATPVAYTVRFVDQSWRWRQIAPDCFEVQFEVEEFI